MTFKLTVCAAALCVVFLFLGLPSMGEAPAQTPSETFQTPSEIVVDTDVPLEDPGEDELPEEVDLAELLEETDEDEPVVDTDAFTLSVSGQQSWGVRLGMGDPLALAAVGLTPWVPVLEQSLRADITGTALDFLTLEASFNDQLGPGFQRLAIKLDRDPWTGELGDFSAGVAELGVYNKQLLGARLTYQGEGFTVSGVAAREQGISEEMVFRARSAEGRALFTYLDPEEPGVRAPYRRSVLGLYHQTLRLPFVEGFSEVFLVLPKDDELRAFLRDYELEYLMEIIGPEPGTKVDAGVFSVVRDEGEDVLILRNEPEGMLRRRVRNAIDAYNEKHGLQDADRERYPFVMDSELERGFLDDLKGRSALDVDGERYPLNALDRQSYVLLGERDILEDTLELAVRRPGDAAFVPIDDPLLSEYRVKLFSGPGILRMDFPEDFFRENAGLRAEYSYSREGNVFSLGLSIVPASEEVYVDGRRLTRDRDYTIDYEVGVLILFSPLGADEEMRVAFERQRGALGVPTDYERGVFAVTVSVPGIDGLELVLAQATDFGRPQPDTPTMPGTHSVVGMRLKGDLGEWSYQLNLGGSDNLFPPGDNMRVPRPNRINVVASAKGGGVAYTVFGHGNGLTVFDGQGFAHYGPGEGLGGRDVRDILQLPEALLVAADAGLTLVHLEQAEPFDRVGSWVRLRPDRPGEGFPGEDVVALALGGGTVFAASDSGMSSAPLEKMELREGWERWDLPDGAVPTALLWEEGILYLGTTTGLYAWDGTTWERVSGVAGAVRDLVGLEGTVYVATARGVRAIRDGTGAGWVAPGEDARSLAVLDGALWYAGPSGLWRAGEPAPVVSTPLRAIGAARGFVWAGDEADGDRKLDLWRVRADDVERLTPDETGIEGRDLGAFEDPAETYTARGVIGGVTLTRETGDWRWQVEATSRWPGYLEIGRSVGTDIHGVGFTARYGGDGPWSGGVQGRWELSALASSPVGALAGVFDLAWSRGPTYALRLTPTVEDVEGLALEGLKSGYRLSASWPGDVWSGRLLVSGSAEAATGIASGTLEGSTTIKPVPSVAIDLAGFRPYHTDGTTGSQGADLTVRWSDSADAVSWAVTWRETLRHRLETDALRWERSIGTTLRWATVELGPLAWTPQLRLSWDDTEQEDRGQAQLTGGLRTDHSVWQLGVTLAQGYRPAIERTARSLSTNLDYEFRGWPTLTPSIRWQGAWEHLTHPVYGERSDVQHVLRGRLTWKLDAGLQNQLDLSYRSRDASYELVNRLTFPTDWGTASAEAKAEWRTGRLEGTATASTSWRLGDMWGVQVRMGYAMTWRPGDTVRHGLHAGASLTASF